MSLACPHCGSDRPAIADGGYRNACPACAGPRLPEGAAFRDASAEQAGVAALVRARAKGNRVVLSQGIFAVLMISAALSVVGGIFTLMGIIGVAAVFGSLASRYRRRDVLRALRVKSDLDEAYALAGVGSAALAPGAHLRVMVEARPDARIAPTKHDDEDARVLAEAEAEAEKEDAFADFDRRLAASRKKD